MASELHPWRFELVFFSFQFGYPVVTSHFAATPQSDVVRIIMCIWFSASWRRFRYDKKCLFSCIYNAQITISPTSLFSVNFNQNRVKNHPKPWTCPLSIQRDGQWHGRHLGPCREREEVSHKLTGSSLVTQRVNKRATACYCYWLAEHIFEQCQGSYWCG